MSGDERARVIAEVLGEHRIECTGSGEVSCRCRDPKGWMSWHAYHKHVAAAVAAALPTPAPEADWPCADYKAPLTCLTTPKRKTLRCDWCRSLPNAEDVQRLYPTKAPAGEDATLTAERLAELLRLHEAAGTGFAAIQRRELLAVLALAQRGVADRATLAAVRALADEWDDEADEDARWLNGPRVSVSEAQELPATIRQGRSRARVLRALLDGPDAGGGRRE